MPPHLNQKRARQDAGNPAGIGVFHVVEVARVLDYSQRRFTRVVNAIIPVVKPDMVSYSSYDSSLLGFGFRIRSRFPGRRAG